MDRRLRGRSSERSGQLRHNIVKSASENLLRNASGAASSVRGLIKSPSGQLVAAIHSESKWEEGGGWRPRSGERRLEYGRERDASMVNLLNLLDPDSLVDISPSSMPLTSGQGGPRQNRSGSFEDHEQHSALSMRGVALVGSASTFAWYVLRLVLRDRLALASTKSRTLLELHLLSSLHAIGWVVFLLKKLRGGAANLSQYCSRALVCSLGFYIHDCIALRGTILRDPGMITHQASVAITIAAILRSKGVAWLAPPLMSLSVPTLVQELLRMCGVLGLPATRLEVRGLRALWFASFAASKFALLPLWLKHRNAPELHQPNLLVGKLSYLLGLALNVRFIASATYNLPKFLRPAGAMVAARDAYRVPLELAKNVGTAVVAGGTLSFVFGSYLTAPAAAILALLSTRSGSSGRLRALAGISCAVVAVDQTLPNPSDDCLDHWPYKILVYLAELIPRQFRHRFYPDDAVLKTFSKDRNYLLAVSPHGFFPWGVAMILIDLLKQGYKPNFVGASVLGALPVAGRILRCFGYRPATKECITSCLAKPYPNNVTVIVPGGIAEMFALREDVELSVANARKGFVDIAKENGAMLVPGYLLGSSKLYEVAQGALGEFFSWLSRKTRMSMNLFHGRWGTLLPYPHPLAVALGRPIDTREFTDTTKIHELWLQGLRDAFNESKAAFGWPNRQLYFEGEDIPPPPKDGFEAYSALPQLSRL